MKTIITTTLILFTSSCLSLAAQAQKSNTKNDLNFQSSMHTNLKTAPENVQSAYAADFPSSLNINWSSEPGMWYVRCDDMNSYKCLTEYKSNGTKVFTARNMKAGEVPAQVTAYCAENGVMYMATIIQIEVPGDPNFWRITTTAGQKIFISNAGMETTCTINGFATY